MITFLTLICVNRPQWVNNINILPTIDQSYLRPQTIIMHISHRWRMMTAVKEQRQQKNRCSVTDVTVINGDKQKGPYNRKMVKLGQLWKQWFSINCCVTISGIQWAITQTMMYHIVMNMRKLRKPWRSICWDNYENNDAALVVMPPF